MISNRALPINDIVLLILSALLTISLGLSAYVFNNLDGRLSTVELAVASRTERIAILEQQLRDNAEAHRRIETKLDTLHDIILRKMK